MRSRPCTRRVALGQSLASALRNARVWGKRQAALERAVRRIAGDDVAAAAALARGPRRVGEGARPAAIPGIC